VGLPEARDAPPPHWRISRGVCHRELKDGHTIAVIKDLKVKGASSVVKVGAKVKNIRLVEGDHDIDCRIESIGATSAVSRPIPHP
jgi:protein PhnA